MGRTGSGENKGANTTYGVQSQQAFNKGQGDISNYRSGETTLESGGNIGADPFKSAAYLGNVNRLQSEALNSATDAGKNAIQQENLRTGGLNSSIVPLATRDISLQRARLADQLSAERAANDYRANLTWQQQLLQNRLAPAGAEQGYYGTATGGQGNALSNLTQLGTASYGPWNATIGALGNIIAAPKGGSGGCWIAEALFGETDPRTLLLRSWLNREFKQHRFGRAVMSLYMKYGERIAAVARRSLPLRIMLRPFFELALAAAVSDRGTSVTDIRREVA